MKTIKNGLVAAALSFSLSSCFYIIKEEPDYYELDNEQIILNHLWVDNGLCTEAIATLDYSGYDVVCDWRHYYSFSRASANKLKWGDWSYIDTDNDKRVDRIEHNGNPVIWSGHSQFTNDYYNNIQNELREDYVQRMWELRWRNR